MNTNEKYSKVLSYILRHNPESVDITLEKYGYVNVAKLIEKINLHKNMNLTFEELEIIVKENPKQRFSFDETKTLIRANQGHSIPVDLGLKPCTPPNILYHGTATRFKNSIDEIGLIPNGRQQVHLSSDIDTATAVGKRHGKVYVYKVDCKKMVQDGFVFYMSENKVWLTDKVPAEYLSGL